MFAQNTLTRGVALFASLPAILNIPSVAAQGASSFDLGHVQLLESRWSGNQERTLNYLNFIDLDRLLYVFRDNHGLDTQGAEPNGGWDAPDFPFRSHIQGHFLTAWSHCWTATGSDECHDRAEYLVAELAKCQANNEAAGYTEGYLSGFPESEIEKVENRTLDNGNVPYYAIHKTMHGLLDVYRHMNNDEALDVLLGMAGWVDERTGRLSESELQEMMRTEYGGMNDILAQLATETGDDRWVDVARRFDHADVFDPLADNVNDLDGLHANTQAQKFIGVLHEYFATGEERYLEIARNAYNFVVQDYTYAIGGNSQAEHFHEPGNITGYLHNDTCETCNTYNMLKVTRELWATAVDGSDDSSAAHYFDYYEQALLNHLLGVQHPKSDHGHITYFTPLNPGGRRGIGPAWGGGTWSTDYDSFWCCQATSLETNTKLMDSIYWHARDDEILYVNLYIPSTLSWEAHGVTITQRTEMPVESTVTFEIGGSGTFDLALRIPDWTTEEASVLVNGETADGVSVEPGSYAVVSGREWQDGDEVTLELPMDLRTVHAMDDESVAAIVFGPTVLAADYGDSELSSIPALDTDSITRVGEDGLSFEATADGETVTLSAFYDAHDYNYNVYWQIGSGGGLTRSKRRL